MIWADFYDLHWDWADSTKRTKISALEDIGSGEEIVEVVYEIEDPKIKAQLIRKAMKLGAKFTSDDLMELEGALPCELYTQLAQYCGFDNISPFFDENDGDYLNAVLNSPKPERSDGLGFVGGLFAVLVGLFSGMGQNSGRKHPHYCDGNCDACPPHYGYRYGRWYYGHGHQHGCERGGNGGASGRTYRD